MYSRRSRSTRNASATAAGTGSATTGRTTRGRSQKAKNPRRGGAGGNPDTARVRASIERPPVVPWIRVMRPPAPHLRNRKTFLVEKWVRPSDLKEEERIVFEKERAEHAEETQQWARLQQERREQKERERIEKEKQDKERQEKEKEKALAEAAAAEAATAEQQQQQQQRWFSVSLRSRFRRRHGHVLLFDSTRRRTIGSQETVRTTVVFLLQDRAGVDLLADALGQTPGGNGNTHESECKCKHKHKHKHNPEEEIHPLTIRYYNTRRSSTSNTVLYNAKRNAKRNATQRNTEAATKTQHGRKTHTATATALVSLVYCVCTIQRKSSKLEATSQLIATQLNSTQLNIETQH
mmetsp:Transcript_4681/g.13498  ORF Transcript_4681/g.13498 Transcript_4681/m.13498 type:complete len:350 (-) Transcript_4681:901-1950(-)